MGWEDSMKGIKTRLVANQSLRHGISMVPVSKIAQQYYCEQKVEMTYLYGETKTEAMPDAEVSSEASRCTHNFS